MLQPGDRFNLTHYVDPELDGEYLVTQVHRKVDQGFEGDRGGPPSTIANEFVAIRSDVVYRPPRVTPRPNVGGLLYATLDGPGQGLPAPLDAMGQYNVVLPWDVAAEGGGKCSRRIRMAQPLSGPSYGVQFSLHEGTDVLLAHVDGDPDRPVIVATVPNALNVPPVTNANPTQSILRTATGITVEFEDDA
jgi:type VI secretion system secreted protein VgrG